MAGEATEQGGFLTLEGQVHQLPRTGSLQLYENMNTECKGTRRNPNIPSENVD